MLDWFLLCLIVLIVFAFFNIILIIIVLNLYLTIKEIILFE